MDVDEVLKQIGEYGIYQKYLLVYVFLPCMLPCGFHAYVQLFLATAPPNCCLKNQSAYIVENKTCTDGFEFTALDEVFVIEYISKELLICESNFRLTIALVLFGVAGFIGSYVFGYLQDRVGRQPSFFLYLFIECIFGVSTSFTPNFWLWLFMRFGVGFTVPAILSTPYVLPIELVGPEYRTRCSILSNIAYSLGLVALSGVVYWFKNWRFLSFITSAPFLFYFLYWWYMPESPRWLLASGRFDDAVEVLKKIAKVNGKELSHIHVLKLQERFLIKKEPSLVNNSKQYKVADLFRNKSLRFKTLIIVFIWFTNTSVYVGLSYYAPVLSGDKYLNFFLAGAVELPTYLILWPAMERYGRREILCSSMLIGGVACLATLLVESGSTILILYCIGKMGISSSYVVLPLFVSELYPTVVRGIGMSVGTVAGMLGPVFIPIINYWMSLLPHVINELLDNEPYYNPLSSLYDQHFGLGLWNDSLRRPMLTGHVRPLHRFHPENCVSSITNQKDNLKVSLDVQQFKPEEINVKIAEGYLVVDAKHEEKQDKHGFISRQFTRRYKLPENVNLEAIKSNLSSDGILTIDAPKKLEENEAKEIPIPVVVTNQPAIKQTKPAEEKPGEKMVA